MSSQNDGIIVILSSPSGAGKTTLVKLLSQRKNFNISVSHTTREPRSNEIEGKDYFFINNKDFENLIKNNQFLEHAKVFDNLYKLFLLYTRKVFQHEKLPLYSKFL